MTTEKQRKQVAIFCGLEAGFEVAFTHNSVIKVNMESVCSSFRLLMLVAICLKLYFGLGVEIYIKPSSNSPCPVKTCRLTLSQFSSKSVLDSLNQNTTLLFSTRWLYTGVKSFNYKHQQLITFQGCDFWFWAQLEGQTSHLTSSVREL